MTQMSDLNDANVYIR